jgi:hypothetical protein
MFEQTDYDYWAGYSLGMHVQWYTLEIMGSSTKLLAMAQNWTFYEAGQPGFASRFLQTFPHGNPLPSADSF